MRIGKSNIYFWSVVLSYSQIFFSNKRLFAILLLLSTFLDYFTGVCGLLAAVIANSIAYLMGLDKEKIKNGLYGFNSLLVGLGLGVYYHFDGVLIAVILVASVLTLFITVFLEGLLQKINLPFLSLPFILGIWIITIATRHFHALQISERGVFFINELYHLGGQNFVTIYEQFLSLKIPKILDVYLNSLGAIYFQSNIVAGIIVALGLLYYSRIAFILSWLGLFAAYYFYVITKADFTQVSYTYIGFNFILTAIATGGFFVISGKRSILWMMMLMPLVVIFNMAAEALCAPWQLSPFSLSFNLVVLLYLFVLQTSAYSRFKPALVQLQLFSPENNLYEFRNKALRFANFRYFSLSLPFFGEWKVTQAFDGAYTHQKQWKYAYDFEIEGANGRFFKTDGKYKEDYFCYQMPVLAPAAGYIEKVVDVVEDNPIGEINLQDNWGNTIIIRHDANLFTKLCHLKPGSIKVKEGDYVRKGDVLAYCGNSGRSPQPHLHFQVQPTPYIGSATIKYPFACYLSLKEGEQKIHFFDYPKLDEKVQNVQSNPLLLSAFNFISGQRIMVDFEKSGVTKSFKWFVETDVYNQQSIYCPATKSRAYFINAHNYLIFTSYYGSKKSPLFYFYLAHYKLIFGFYQGLQINDIFSLHVYNKKVLMPLHDIVAPVAQFMKSPFTLKYEKVDDIVFAKQINLSSSANILSFGKKIKEMQFQTSINQEKKHCLLIAKNKMNCKLLWQIE